MTDLFHFRSIVLTKRCQILFIINLITFQPVINKLLMDMGKELSAENRTLIKRKSSLVLFIINRRVVKDSEYKVYKLN